MQIDKETKKFLERNTPKYKGINYWCPYIKSNIHQIVNKTKKRDTFKKNKKK